MDPSQAPPGQPPPAGLRVLLADDNRDAIFLLSRLLRNKGYEVRCASDGLEALQAGAEFQPHVVLLDIGMPRMNGYETARRMRQEPWGLNVLLIAVTGWGEEEDRLRSQEAGFDQHFVKPLDPRVLLTLLAELPKA